MDELVRYVVLMSVVVAVLAEVDRGLVGVYLLCEGDLLLIVLDDGGETCLELLYRLHYIYNVKLLHCLFKSLHVEVLSLVEVLVSLR